MSLETPKKIREFPRKLHRKAKQEPAYRFYLLPSSLRSVEPSNAELAEKVRTEACYFEKNAACMRYREFRRQHF